MITRKIKIVNRCKINKCVCKINKTNNNNYRLNKVDTHENVLPDSQKNPLSWNSMKPIYILPPKFSPGQSRCTFPLL